MPLQAKVPGDPRRPNDVVNYKFKSAKDDDLPDIYLMAALFLGMGAILLKQKLVAWGAVLCVLCALSNYGPKADVKQMLSSGVFALFGLGTFYLVPAQQRLAAAA